jgi:hypothetical protein
VSIGRSASSCTRSILRARSGANPYSCFKRRNSRSTAARLRQSRFHSSEPFGIGRSRLARLELLEKAEQILFDAVSDETAPIRDRVRAAFYILDTVPPPDWWPGRRGRYFMRGYVGKAAALTHQRSGVTVNVRAGGVGRQTIGRQSPAWCT